MGEKGESADYQKMNEIKKWKKNILIPLNQRKLRAKWNHLKRTTNTSHRFSFNWLPLKIRISVNIDGSDAQISLLW